MMCWAIMQTSLHHHSQDLYCTFLTTSRPSIPLPQLRAFQRLYKHQVSWYIFFRLQGLQLRGH